MLNNNNDIVYKNNSNGNNNIGKIIIYQYNSIL